MTAQSIQKLLPATTSVALGGHVSQPAGSTGIEAEAVCTDPHIAQGRPLCPLDGYTMQEVVPASRASTGLVQTEAR